MSFSFNKPCDCRSGSWPAIGRDCPVSCRDALRGASRPGVEALLAGTRGEPGRPWLCPRFGSLTPPGGPLRQILVGHSDRVEAVAFLPAGRRALSGSRDATLRLWDLETGETLQTLEGHTSWVMAVAVLADGRRALSGSGDQTLRLWDLETGETLRTLQGHRSSVYAVAVLADGRRALSGSDDTTLRLWNFKTGATLRTLEGHTDGVSAVAVLADGSRALSGSDDHTLRLWDLETGARLAEFTADAAISCGALARDDLIVAGSADGRIHILEIREP